MQARQEIRGILEGALQDAKNRIKELKYSVRIFKAQIQAGEPWPGENRAS